MLHRPLASVSQGPNATGFYSVNRRPLEVCVKGVSHALELYGGKASRAARRRNQ
jgi:hypothetical protein